MKVTKTSLAKLESDYRGYLEGEKLDRFFDEFKIKFAAGYWAAGSFADRFNLKGYDPKLDNSITSQLERIAKAKIRGVEIHDTVFIDDDNNVNKDKIALVKATLSRLGLEVTNMNTDLFSNPKWKFGGITNPDKSVRKEALAIALQSVDIAREVGCKSVALWPGSDGWDYNFETNYGLQLEWFVDGCIAINKKAKSFELSFGIEAKLHEPREGNMIIPTTHMAILISRMVNEVCGGANMGVAIDYGHEQMYAVEPASMLYVAKKAGVPVVNFHLNNAKVHSNDEDRIAGTGDVWRFTDFCYAAVDTGYNGWFGEDQFTYRTDPVKSMILSRELFGNLMKKALLIYAHKDELTAAQATGDATAAIDVVKKRIIAE